MTSDYSDYLFDLSWMHNFHNDLLSEGLLVTTSYAILFDEITYIEGFGLMESLVSRMRYDGYWLAISDDVSANSVMRAEVIKLIVNLSGYPIYAANPPSFADVPPSHPYYNYVETALWYGFIDPTPFFEPERSVTSEEFLNYFYL
jgi:hypothetical protein